MGFGWRWLVVWLVLMGPGGGRVPGATGPTEGIRQLQNYYLGEGPTLEKLSAFIGNLVYDSTLITPEQIETLVTACRSDPVGGLLALPLPDGTCASVLAALSSLRGVLGEDGARRAFGAVLTDNGSEFADEGAIAALLGERDGETRLFYCDPRQSQQKGACEKNHVEIRKLLPKGAGVRFDRLTAADCALLMSQVNSEPRGALGFLTPARVLRMALGEDASALMDAFGIEELAPGELDLTPGCIERARAARGEGPLAG